MVRARQFDSSAMTDLIHDERDPRLDRALTLLQKPVRKQATAAGPLLAATLLACAGAALVYFLTLPAEKPNTARQADSHAQPAFELSASSQAASEETPPVRDAVIMKDEETR